MSNPNRLKETGSSKRFRLSELLPDAQNRRLRDWRVDQIARNFDFAKWSPPVVRHNGNGQPTIIEGHHRVVAACKAGLGDLEVITYCHPPVETDSRVGEMYIGLNDTMASTSVEKFLMRLRANDLVATRVATIIEATGFDGISATATDGHIHSTSACEWVYRGGLLSSRNGGETPEALGFALSAIKQTYGKTKVSVRPEYIRGFGTFAHRYPGIAAPDVARKVRAKHPDPLELSEDAKVMQEALRVKASKGLALVIRRDFNHNRKRPLEEW